MNPLDALVLLLALLAVTTVSGVVWRFRQGRVTVVAGDTVTAADVAPAAVFGPAATLLQFSTEFCARCPATHRLLAAVADSRPGVVHVDVDLTHRADLAQRFSILQTPTTLILDGAGRVHARVGGAPHRAAINSALDALAIGSAHPVLTTTSRSAHVDH